MHPLKSEPVSSRLLIAPGVFVYFDSSDWPLLSKYRWRPMVGKYTTYAVAFTVRDQNITMHRLLLGAKGHIQVDHADGAMA